MEKGPRSLNHTRYRFTRSPFTPFLRAHTKKRELKKGDTEGTPETLHFRKYGAANGIRTRDPKNHNLVL